MAEREGPYPHSGNRNPAHRPAGKAFSDASRHSTTLFGWKPLRLTEGPAQQRRTGRATPFPDVSARAGRANRVPLLYLSRYQVRPPAARDRRRITQRIRHLGHPLFRGHGENLHRARFLVLDQRGRVVSPMNLIVEPAQLMRALSNSSYGNSSYEVTSQRLICGKAMTRTRARSCSSTKGMTPR